MILGELDHIETYKNLSGDIYDGLVFLKNASPDIKVGTYPVSQKVKAIVSEYNTVEHFKRGYEAHKHVIDIQYPIKGFERIKWSPIKNMDINIPYDPVKDRTFFKTPYQFGTEVIIGNGVFAIMFPEDGHGPQHFVKEIELIKKITIKVSI